MDMLQLTALMVTASLCALTLRKAVPELSVVLLLAAGAVCLGETLSVTAAIRGFSDALARTAGLAPEVWRPVWKTVGIGVVARLGSALCKDAGESGAAAFLETAGAALALAAALPLAEAVLDTLEGFL